MKIFPNQDSKETILVLDPMEVWHFKQAMESWENELAIEHKKTGAKLHEDEAAKLRTEAYGLGLCLRRRCEALEEAGAFSK